MKINKIHLKKALQGEPNRSKHPAILRRIFSFEENIELFSEFFFGHVMTSISPSFHKDIYEVLFKDSNDALAAPRGHAKSTITGLIFLIFCIVNKRERYIVYVSQNHSKTVQFLQPIRDEFKNNKLLQYVYGDLSPKNTKDDSGKDREDCFDVGGARIEAVSFEKNLRGFKYNNIRPTLIIGDDIESDERVLNPELRAKDFDKLNKIIIPSLDINGRFKFIGTILHVDSLLSQKIAQYKGLIFKACTPDFKEILWPERFTKKKLMEIEVDIGSVAFEQEYLNNPINARDNIIKREWLHACRDDTLSYDDARKMQYSFITEGTDFAFSDRITADKSAFVSLGKYNDQYITLLSETRKGLSVNEQMTLLQDFHKNIKFDAVGLEENSIKAISKDIDQYNMPITLFWTSATDPAAKLKPGYDWNGKRHTVGKTTMIQRLGSAIEHEKIVFPYKTGNDKRITDEIISECMSYALSDGKLVEATVHPDIPIALGYALELQHNSERMIMNFG